MTRHCQIVEVTGHQLDPFGQISVASLGGFLQDAASQHVRALGLGIEALQQRGLTWVMTALKLEVLAAIGEGDRLTVETWSCGSDRLTLLRAYELRGPSRAVVARAMSHWLLLEGSRRRPVRPESVIDAALLAPSPPTLALRRERLSQLPQWDEERRIGVRYADIDMNLHANNSAYLSWLVESLPESIWRQQRLAAAEVQYLAECPLGSEVLSRSRPRTAAVADQAAFEHEVIREPDGRELVRAVTGWAPRRRPQAPSAGR